MKTFLDRLQVILAHKLSAGIYGKVGTGKLHRVIERLKELNTPYIHIDMRCLETLKEFTDVILSNEVILISGLDKTNIVFYSKALYNLKVAITDKDRTFIIFFDADEYDEYVQRHSLSLNSIIDRMIIINSDL